MTRWDLFQGFQVGLTIKIIDQYNLIQQKTTNKSYVIISMDSENSSGKTVIMQYPLLNKSISKVGMERSFLNLIKDIFGKPTNIIAFNSERLNTFPKREATRQGSLHLLFLFNIY